MMKKKSWHLILNIAIKATLASTLLILLVGFAEVNNARHPPRVVG